MIQEPSAPTTGTAADPQPVTTPATELEGRWGRLGVGVSAFVRSLNPNFDPTNSRPPVPGAAGSDPQGIDSLGNFLQITALAGRVVSACGGMSPGISSLLGNLPSLFTAGQCAWDQFNAFTARAEPGTHRENRQDGAPENAKDKDKDKEKTSKAPQNTRQKITKSVANTQRFGQLPKTSLALGALAGFSAVGASSVSNPGTDDWVDVADAGNLGNICDDTESCRRKYRLTRDIDGRQLNRSIGNESVPFTGELNGQGHTIGNLSRCLVENLKGGHIDNLTLSDANITSSASTGVAACKISGDAIVSNIQVARAEIHTTKGAPAAIAVGEVNGGKLTNTAAVNCNVITSGRNAFTKPDTEFAKAGAGIGVGVLRNGTVANTVAVNCRVETKEIHNTAGVGAGFSFGGTVFNTTAVNCHVKTEGRKADAGIGAGYQHEGTVIDTTAVNCTLTTSRLKANAGIGAGVSKDGTVSHTRAVDCEVTTRKKEASAGIGVGLNKETGNITDTTAVGCTVKTSGSEAFAGIGVGNHHSTGQRTGTVSDTIAVNCKVRTERPDADAGIGAGRSSLGKDNVYRTRAIDTNVTSKTNKQPSDIIKVGGDKPVIICNVRINGAKLQDNTDQCRSWRNRDHCKKIDRRLVTSKCQLDYDGIDTLYGANALLPPAILETGPKGSTKAMSYSSPASVTTTLPTTGATSGMNSSSQGSATMSTAPNDYTKVPSMAFSTSDPSRFARQTPLAGSLNTTVIAYIALGVSLGVVLFVLAGTGLCAYRHYRQRLSAQAGRNREEPMPMHPEGRPRSGIPLSTLPQSHYQLSDRPLPTPPQRHYQPLLDIQGNTATGGSNSTENTEQEPDPGQQRPDSPLYQELIGFASAYRCSSGESVEIEQAGMITADSNPMVSTEEEPDQQRPASPVYHVLTKHESTCSDLEPVEIELAGMVTGDCNPMVSTEEKPAPPVHLVLPEHEPARS
ncbi:ZmpA/ZmpB/ZmpC family metallo-endopeptidase-related protein [Endozoicomonas acroporae]|uniref:ZmpA/ZmpB/ZmpC family metallo-endopeptidase-related protein n=1 Tax=Endozoicomonas acroporae TaxID=1701104 RepID=UPI000C774867|nr:ZmpA/ZmpB/ZmpC family metallo-endopeptidase-related protein [Endozoicomonas acroporae]